MTIHDPSGAPDPGPSSERLRKPAPERTGPIRNPANLRNGSAHGDDKSTDDVMAYGIELGYKVIEEQIARARQLAEQWSSPGGSAADPRDWAQFAHRMVNACRDLGAVYFDAVERLVDIAVTTVSESPAAAARAAPTPRIRLRSDVAAEVELDLAPGALDGLAITPLHGPAGAPPITTAGFLDPQDGRPVLSVELSGPIPAGAYSGVVVERSSNEPRGTLCIRVIEA